MRIFSRNCEDCTAQFPDVCAAVAALKADSGLESFVLDAEIVPVDQDSGNKVRTSRLGGGGVVKRESRVLYLPG